MRRAFAVLLLGGVCIGFAPIFVRWSDTGPVASAFWRALIASLVLWAWRLAARRGRSPMAFSRDAVLSGLMFAGDLAVWHISILHTTVANATLLANLAPVAVTLAAWILRGEKPRAGFLAGLAISLAGAFILIGLNVGGDDSRSLGDLLGVTTAVFYAGYMLAITRARRDTDALTLMTISTSVTALALLPIAAAFSSLQGSRLVPDAASGWLVLAGLALVAQVAGQTLIAYAAARLPVALSSTTLLIQPLVAALAAWMLFGERLSPLQIGGGGVLVLGLWLARRGSAAPASSSASRQSRTENL